ncbi:C40 family peptidase [Micrococcales bacterium 31B]|nr:C40 family peptidase [Micrococcales bacterium 31B]
MTNLQTGAGYPLSMAEWGANGFTKFAVQKRITGDQFYQFAGSADVWYAGPGVNRKITFAEWVGAGQPKPAIRGSVAGTAASSSDQAILNVARKYIGVPYVWGGSTPSGFDCSGFTSYVYRQVGITIPRTSQAQWGAGRAVSEAQARPGDLVVMSGGGHIGIYVGNGRMIDSPKPGTSVQERPIFASTRYFVTFR